MQPLNTCEDIDVKIETSSDSGATELQKESAYVDAMGPQEDNMTESMAEFKQESTADVDTTGPQEDNMTESMAEFKQESTADVDTTGSQEDNMTESMAEFKQESTADVDTTGSQEDNMTESMAEFKQESTADVDTTGSQEDNMTESMAEFKQESTADVDTTGSQEDNMTESMAEFKQESTADVDTTGSQEDNMTESMAEFKQESTADVDTTGSQEDNVTESMTEFKQPSTTDIDISNCDMSVKKEDDSTPNIEQVSESTWYMQNPDCTISVNTDNDSSVLCPPSNDVSISELLPSTKPIIEHVSESRWCMQNPDCVVGVKIDNDGSGLCPPSNDPSTSELLPSTVSEMPMQEHGYSMVGKWQRNKENNETHNKAADIDATVNHVQPDMTPVNVASGSTNILDETMETPELETKKRRSKRQSEQRNSILLVIPSSCTTVEHVEGDQTPTDSADIEGQAADECHQFVKIEKTEPAETELTPISSSSPDVNQTLIQAPEECHKIRKKRKSKAKPTDTDLAILASLKSDTRPALKQPAEGFEEQTRQAFECICGDHEIEPDDVKPRAQCEKCGLWQHADCIKYDLSDPHRGRYLCPHCHAVVVSGRFIIHLYSFSHFVCSQPAMITV